MVLSCQHYGKDSIMLEPFLNLNEHSNKSKLAQLPLE